MPSGVHRESTRLAIVEQAIADTLERLQELAPGPRAPELRAKAEGYERAHRPSVARPPTVEQAIADPLERLQELVPGPRARELRAKAEGYERAHRAWVTRPPTEEQRS